MTRIVAGDIGGTNIRLVLDEDGTEVRRDVLSTAEYGEGGVPAALAAFLDGEAMPDAFCVGYAGAVRNGRAVGTNVAFPIDEADIREKTGIAHVRVLNDLEAAAYGLPVAPEDDIVTLIEGEPEEGAPRGIVAPGTGLGEATLLFVEGKPHVMPMEGGQAGFSPITPELHRLAGALERRVRIVRVEDVISGPGILEIHDFVRRIVGIDGADFERPAQVTEAALAGRDAAAKRTLELFVAALGLECRNLAVRALAYGGIYLAGGIVPAVLDALRWPAFREAFREIGVSAHMVETVPVYAVTSDALGLLGSREVARSLIAS